MALATPLGAILAMGGRRKEVTIRNLTACFPEKTPDELQALTRAHCREFMRMTVESAVLWHWPLERLYDLVKEVRGQHYLDEARAEGRGLIHALPHCGSWELFYLYFARSTDHGALYKPIDQPALEELMARQRERSGGRLFAADASGLPQAYKHLQAGNALVILPDQQPKAGEGQFAPFFGVSALTMTLLSKMAQRSGSRVVFSMCERINDNSGYRIHHVPADPDLYSSDLQVSLAALNRGVEACANIAPEQYLWCYKRFSVRPEGEGRFY
jgi:KDO2-lipid IV(A) lauroyltransferase